MSTTIVFDKHTRERLTVPVGYLRSIGIGPGDSVTIAKCRNGPGLVIQRDLPRSGYLGTARTDATRGHLRLPRSILAKGRLSALSFREVLANSRAIILLPLKGESTPNRPTGEFGQLTPKRRMVRNPRLASR